MQTPASADVAAYLSITNPDEATLAEISVSVAVAVAEQAARCDVSDYSVDLWQAARRRAARDLAARGAVLGLVDIGELGAVRMSGWDARIEALEAPYRRAALA